MAEKREALRRAELDAHTFGRGFLRITHDGRVEHIRQEDVMVYSELVRPAGWWGWWRWIAGIWRAIKDGWQKKGG